MSCFDGLVCVCVCVLSVHMSLEQSDRLMAGLFGDIYIVQMVCVGIFCCVLLSLLL